MEYGYQIVGPAYRSWPRQRRERSKFLGQFEPDAFSRGGGCDYRGATYQRVFRIMRSVGQDQGLLRLLSCQWDPT
jgi:hypothetical protein